MVVHSGTSEAGHYYCYIKNREAPEGEEQWFTFNDKDVEVFDKKDISPLFSEVII